MRLRFGYTPPTILATPMRWLLLTTLLLTNAAHAQAEAATSMQHALTVSGSMIGGMLMVGSALASHPDPLVTGGTVLALPLATAAGAVVGASIAGRPVAFVRVLPAAALGTLVGLGATVGVVWVGNQLIRPDRHPSERYELFSGADVGLILVGAATLVAVPAAFAAHAAIRRVSVAPTALRAPNGGSAPGVSLRLDL